MVGPRPTTVAGLKNWQRENIALNQLSGELWGAADGKKIFENTYGKGRVIWGYSADEVLQKKQIEPDFSFTAPSEIDYIHRKDDMGEIYFLRNETDRKIKNWKRKKATDERERDLPFPFHRSYEVSRSRLDYGEVHKRSPTRVSEARRFLYSRYP